jgi:hypothetical protein
MNSLQERINQALPCEMVDADTFSVLDVERAIHKLKAGKADGLIGLASDCLKHAPKRLHVYLAMLLNSIVIHGFTPRKLLIGTMTPIPKTKNCSSSSDKYRAITLISCLVKILDYIVLSRQADAFITDELQLGFKERCSTTLCSLMMTETARIFNSKGSNVYTILLDATKAFDRLEYAKLFTILMDKGMNVLYIRCLLHMYLYQELRVQWNGSYSSLFLVKNGVKQGGVASPLLFGIYLDILLSRLRRSGL